MPSDNDAPFGLDHYNDLAKDVTLRGPLIHDRTDWISVDMDDIDGYVVAAYTRKMIAILNDHWASSVYAHLEPEPEAKYEDGDYKAESSDYDRRRKLKREIMEGLVNAK